MKIRTPLPGIFVLTLIVSTLSLLTPRMSVFAYSALGCDPGRGTGTTGQYTDGWYKDLPGTGATMSEARVTANSYEPYLVSGSTGSAVWAMLQANTNPDDGWAQVGYADGAGGPVFFVQAQPYMGTAYAAVQVYPYNSGITIPTQDAPYTYTVVYNSSANDYTFEIGIGANTYQADIYGTTTQESYSSTTLGWVPQSALMNAEVLNNADQMFGDTSNPEKLSNSQYWDIATGAWTNEAGTKDQTYGYYGFTNPGGSTSELDVWDVGCPVSVTSSDQYMTVNQVLDAVGTGSDHRLVSASGGTYGPYALQSQTDGNLDVYDANGKALWAPGSTTANDYLIMQNDGNIVLYNTWGKSALFNTGTSGDSDAGALVMQSNGDVVLYGEPGNVDPLWDSGSEWDSMNAGLLYGNELSEGSYLGSFPTTGTNLNMQTDGNLVLYKGSTVEWSAGTSNSCPPLNVCWNYLITQTDGNLVVYDYDSTTGGKTALWNSGTDNGDAYDHLVIYYTGTTPVAKLEAITNAVQWSS
jgi:hypothetical protein